MERIVGLLISGFAVKLYGAALALWLGYEAVTIFTDGLDAVNATFVALP